MSPQPPTEPMPRRSYAWVIGLSVVLAVGALIRFPPLLNANDMNSDGAIVGVQALHILEGHFSPHLYGTTYQSSAEAWLAAGLFLLGGPSLFKVALVPFLGMLLLLTLIYFALTRQLTPPRAVLCLLPLAIGSIAVNMPMMYVMRQVMITTLIGGVVILHGAAQSRLSLVRYLLGPLVAGLAVSIDTFALTLGPSVALFTALCVFDDRPGWKRVLARGGLTLVGAAAAVFAARAMGHLLPGAGGLASANFPRNWGLFTEKALPFTFGWQVWKWSHVAPSYSSVWDVPSGLRRAQLFAAVVLFALMSTAAPLAFFRRIPWPTRRLALFGLFGTATAVALFLYSERAGRSMVRALPRPDVVARSIHARRGRRRTAPAWARRVDGSMVVECDRRCLGNLGPVCRGAPADADRARSRR